MSLLKCHLLIKPNLTGLSKITLPPDSIKCAYFLCLLFPDTIHPLLHKIREGKILILFLKVCQVPRTVAGTQQCQMNEWSMAGMWSHSRKWREAKLERCTEALNALVKSLDFYLVSKGKPLKVSGMFRSAFEISHPGKRFEGNNGRDLQLRGCNSKRTREFGRKDQN